MKRVISRIFVALFLLAFWVCSPISTVYANTQKPYRLVLSAVEYYSPKAVSWSHTDYSWKEAVNYSGTAGNNTFSGHMEYSKYDIDGDEYYSSLDVLDFKYTISAPNVIEMDTNFDLIVDVDWNMQQKYQNYCRMPTWIMQINAEFDDAEFFNPISTSEGGDIHSRNVVGFWQQANDPSTQYRVTYEVDSRVSIYKEGTAWIEVQLYIPSEVYWWTQGDSRPSSIEEGIMQAKYIYTIEGTGEAVAPPVQGGEDIPPFGGDDTEENPGESETDIPLEAVVGVVALGGGVVVIIRFVRKKPRKPKPGKTSSPEVYDWRGNKIDENARVRQTQEKYIQANRDAQAQYDERRRAEEAARREHEQQQYKMIEELIRLSERLSTTNRHAAGKMNEITQKQIEAALSGKDISPETFRRISHGFGEFAGGRIIGEDDIPPMPTTTQLAIDAYEDAFEEVCRNETATAVAVRTVSSMLSGGASDKVFQTGKGFYRMKDYIDSGGDSAMGAVTYALFGEARDRAVNKIADKVMWKLPFTPKGGSLPKKIMYDQRKRYVKQAVNAVDKGTVGTNDKALKVIRWIFE